MKKGFPVLLAVVICVLLLGSCSENNDECVYQPDTSGIEVSLQFERLDSALLGVKSKEDLRDFLNDYPVIREYFLRRNQYPNDSVMMQVLYGKFQNPHIDTLQQEINRVFGDLSSLKEELNKAFTNFKYYYPEAELPEIKFIATGLDNDMFISDSLIVVGLDYYLGDSAKYRPLGLYEYMLERYRPSYITPSIMLLYGISSKYNKTNTSDKTMLADMIGYGKSFYFAKHMMPCTPDSLLIWYSRKEISGSRKNEDIVWAHFLENQLLYETDHLVKKKYIEERPKTYEIGEDAPGRIGTWLGWQIVRQYMERNDEVTLHELMQNTDAKEIFNKSHYKPKK
ncbi:gliding motility lipoprotein GldB [Fulvivirga sediminis]|uniref:Gliding motility lipoprotein GldB n=1 Tax=Fulvivirga sediminis TaxID=2803949 RepID=A0A937F7N1_9BACT|nr:gliding motility lipoprotein GldB [Fulvivirga sediminis]MBL3657846.1 gliding motility lipoprotein GldB [Fulvivirga sediminis]